MGTGCNGASGGGSSEPTQPSTGEEVKPFDLQLADVSADVTQIPEGVYVDDFTLEKVTVGETVLESTDYVVRNGYFLFACEQYGAFGTGAKTVRLQFAEGTAEFTLTITDGKEPAYELPEGKVFLLPTVGGTLPAVTRVYPYQIYDVIYTLKDENSSTVYEKTNPTQSELTLDLENGLYAQEIVVKKGENTLDTWAGKLVVADEEDIEVTLPEKHLLFLGEESALPFTLTCSGEPFNEDGVVVYESLDESVATVDENGLVKAIKNGTTQINATVLGALNKTVNVSVCEKNIFSENMAEHWQITTRLNAEGNVVSGTRGNTVWNAEENALVIKKASQITDNTGGSMRIPVAVIEPMLAMGATFCQFEIKVNETYMNTTEADTVSVMQRQTQFAGTNGEKFDYVSGANMDAITQDMLVADEYVTIMLDMTKLINRYEQGLFDRLYLYLGGKKNSEISLRNFAPITAEEYYEINDPFSYMGSKGVQILGTRDAEGNTTTTTLANIWDNDEGAFTTYIDKGAYHGNNDCIRFNVNNGDNHLSAVYLMEKLSALQKAEGKAYIKFDVKVDETYVNSTATNGKAFYFWVRCSQTTLASGIGPSADASNLKADTWTTLYVDAEKLLDYYHNEADYLMYFQFTMYGPAGAKISFRNMQVATQAEYTAATENEKA
ncbi:MAG: Ig-like domain-containing protein [Clostridia bacterium]|nr:Ig-like domain-containing protein [Clostridia bacterium]